MGGEVTYLLFWGHTPSKNGTGGHVLSQWYPAVFTVDGVRYASAEHYMMAGKARLFGDQSALAEVLGSDDPARAKAAGRKVQGFDTARWLAEREGIVLRASLEKFGQNPPLLKYLIGTGEQVLVEASPHDRIWGIGLAADHPDARDPQRWRGDNLLGFVLMDARATLHGAGHRA